MPPLADLWLPGHRENRGCHCGSGACTRRRLQSAHRRAREADAAYIPPGRLRRYDVIILDEISQIDADVWQKIKVALNELHPGPLLLFVGDEQQLQPVVGRPQLLQDLATEVEAGKARRVTLRQHEMKARLILLCWPSSIRSGVANQAAPNWRSSLQIGSGNPTSKQRRGKVCGWKSLRTRNSCSSR